MARRMAHEVQKKKCRAIAEEEVREAEDLRLQHL